MKRGLTLIEVLVALVIAGIIALVARSALVAGMDTQDRLTAHTTRTEGDARFRALIVQALRHIADAPAVGMQAFALRDTVVEGGAASHIAEFYSRGLAHPAGTGAVTRVRLAPSAEGLTIVAIGPDGATLLSGVAPGIGGMRMRLRRVGTGDWVDAWPRSLVTPAAVAIEFTPIAASGTASAPVPLVVATRLEERP
jgi:prepilin-type N-terminal cleavage/methylation domain-containing protein